MRMQRRKKDIGVRQAILISLVLVSLASCAAQTAVEPSSTQSPTGKRIITPTPVASGAPLVEQDEIRGENLSLSCDDLLTVEELYTYNPNFALDRELAPIFSSTAKEFEGYKGITCSYLNLSSGNIIQISVAKLDPPSSLKVQDKLLSSNNSAEQDPANETTTLFSMNGDTGNLTLLRNSYFISVHSNQFAQQEEAMKFVTPILAKL